MTLRFVFYLLALQLLVASFPARSTGEVPFEAGRSYRVGNRPADFALADLNGDASPDLIAANYLDDSIALLLNQGDGTYGDTARYNVGAGPMGILATDLDGDLDRDIIVANSGSNSVSLLFNDGAGELGFRTDFRVGAFPQALAATDLDGDGDQDVIVANRTDASISVLANGGSGVLTLTTSYPTGSGPRAIVAVDLDGDLLSDIAVVNEYQSSINVYVNSNGTLQPPTTYYTGYYPTSLAAADFDSDDDLDLVWNNSNSASFGVMLNDGSGGFAPPVTFSSLLNPVAITSGDFDGDSDTDVAVLAFAYEDYGWHPAVLIHYNDGAADFEAGYPFGTGYQPVAIARDDVDRDGDTDVAVLLGMSPSGSITVLKNTGTGALSAHRSFNLPPSPKAVCSGDFDGDGSIDLATVARADNLVSVLLNDDNAGFATRADYAATLWPEAIAAADLDRDNDLDLVAANYGYSGAGQTVSVLKNKGDGTFEPKVDYPVSGTEPSSVCAADLDLDGDIDLAVTHYYAFTGFTWAVAILRNNGDGTFAAPIDYQTVSFASRVLASDIDRDGDADLVVSGGYSTSGGLQVHLNDGSGAFVSGEAHLLGGFPSAIWASDLNADGYPDVVSTNNYPYPGALSILLNDGDGALNAPAEYALPWNPTFVTGADLNCDFVPDLAVTGNADEVLLLMNNGLGVFTPDAAYATGVEPRCAAFDDLDGDDDPDLVVLNGASNTIAIHRNLTPAVDRPHIARIRPDTLTWLDTGVDVLIEGSHFMTGAEVLIEPWTSSPVPVKHWSPAQLHLVLDVDVLLPYDRTLTMRVRNPNGQCSDAFAIGMRRPQVPHPRHFAPTFWFAPAENWYPTSPFFADADGNTSYESPVDREADYLGLNEEGRRARAVVYYHIYGDEPHETPVGFPLANSTPCLVYEYWLYFTFDEFNCGPVVVNRHFHDWEKCFVFVGLEDGLVRGVAGRAHLDGVNASSVYEYSSPVDPGVSGFHPYVMVERGGHATCPDINENGVFEYDSDVNGCAQFGSWGIQDGVSGRNPEGKVFGPDGSGQTYRLAALSSLQAVVDPTFTDAQMFWDGSREAFCTQFLCPHLPSLEFLPLSSVTFPNSPIAIADPTSPIVRAERLICPCWDESRPVIAAHIPIEHAWQGKQGEYLSNPRKILPWCYSNVVASAMGTVQDPPGTLCDFGVLLRYFASPAGKTAIAGGTVTDGIFGYAPVAEDGRVAFTDCPSGNYVFSLLAPGAAPYSQNLALSESDTLLGAAGDIILVPEERYFVILCSVKDSNASPVSGAQISFFKEPATLQLPTLTDWTGTATCAADTSNTYTITIDAFAYRDTITGVDGTFADTLLAEFILPFPVTAVDDEDVPVARGSAVLTYPNPFHDVAEFEFEIQSEAIVTFEIFDAAGRRVRTLKRGLLGPGQYHETWDGTNEAREALPSGVYLYRLAMGDRVEKRSIVLLK